MVIIKKLDDMKKMINKICLFLFIALIAASCEDFPVDEDGLLITTRAECYVSNFDLYNADHQDPLSAEDVPPEAGKEDHSD